VHSLQHQPHPANALSRYTCTRYGRDVAPRTPHTISAHTREPNAAQLPRWLKPEPIGGDNWNQRSYVRTAGVSAKCHFEFPHPHTKLRWAPPADDGATMKRRMTWSSCAPREGSPRGFRLSSLQPLASAPSSPRMYSAWLETRKRGVYTV